MKFTKMQGSGNDFVVIDDRGNEFLGRESELGIKLCNRHFGIGGDGVLIIRKSNIAQIKMVIINSDGSNASMCGNGIRCFAKYIWENDIVRDSVVKIETGDGVKEVFLDIGKSGVERITVNMGTPSFKPREIPARFADEIVDKQIEINGKNYKITSLFMGVPHTVIFGELEKYHVEEGKSIEKCPVFPQGTNVNFCEILDKNNIEVKTWERGAGPTLACGTGSCACVAAANKLNLTGKKVKVKVPGGNIWVEIKGRSVFMTGPAEICFKGEYDI
ncbi:MULTISPECIES: diaminopimelate epimerase [Clostridium]|uniref:Diaminopimelate epimerase n=1 Tax=Clostridium lapidicellarium TaxID=3240931 RepID=A0ABV4DST4_9CLOT